MSLWKNLAQEIFAAAGAFEAQPIVRVVLRACVPRVSIAAALTTLAIGPATWAAPFTAGDIAVERIGSTTSGALGSAAAPVFVDEYTPSGTLVQSIALPTTASGSQLRLTDSGSAASDGYLNLSADGKYLTLPGYSAAVGTASVASTLTTGGSAVVRVVGEIDSQGNIDTSTSTTGYSVNNIRMRDQLERLDHLDVGCGHRRWIVVHDPRCQWRRNTGERDRDKPQQLGDL